MRYVYVYFKKKQVHNEYLRLYVYFTLGMIITCKCNQRGNDLMYKILGEADIFSPLYGVGEVDKH